MTNMRNIYALHLSKKNKYKSMVKIRERTKMLLLKFGSAISGTMAKKIATEGFDFNQLKGLRATFPDKAKFIQVLRAKGLSSICSQKLVAYFFQTQENGFCDCKRILFSLKRLTRQILYTCRFFLNRVRTVVQLKVLLNKGENLESNSAKLEAQQIGNIIQLDMKL